MTRFVVEVVLVVVSLGAGLVLGYVWRGRIGRKLAAAAQEVAKL